MNLNNEKIIVAIENAVIEQVEASGFTGELHRLDGEKIVDVILQQIEGFAIKDVFNERQRQINQEFYSIENDDEYKENELVRAAACYTNNVVSRGWTYSSFDPETYQSEEAPDFWPWDLDFWKPKNPRADLVRAAALLIAEIDRMDRAQEQSHEH